MAEMTFCPWCGDMLEIKRIDGIRRSVCPKPECGYIFWNNPIPVVAAILERAGKVVLVRNQGWPEKWFGLVSGFLEKGETPEQGMRREIEEELGLESTAVSFLGLYSFFERNELILAFHVTARGTISPSEEIAAYREIPIEKLKPWPFGTGPAVADWLKSRRK